MKRVFLILLLISVSQVFNACSTVLNTTSQNVEIKSEPPNAKITIDGKKFGTTPQVVNVERGNNNLIKLELEGYDTYETQLTRKISTWFWFNVLNGIIPGMVTDMFTGAMYNLLPDIVEVELQPAKVIEPPAKKR
jgi:hypothetical protein